MRVAFNGLELGDDSLYNITSIEGLDSLPDLTIGMAPKPRRHGSWLGGKLAQKRTIAIGLEIMGDPADDWRTTKPKNALVDALRIQDVEQPLVFDMDYGDPPVLVYASVTALDLPITSGYSRLRTGLIEFTCTDPMKYGAESKAASTGTPTVQPAAPYGQAYGFAYNATTEISGTVSADNTGNSPAPARYTIQGPVERPTITLTDAQGIRETTVNLTLSAQDRLVIDTARNTVLLNGTDRAGSASGALVPDLVLRSGITTVAFTGITDGAPLLTVEWRDASR